MAADNLSTANLPPIVSTSDTSSRNSGQSSPDEKNRPRKLEPKQSRNKLSCPEVDFEQIEHELDSIA